MKLALGSVQFGLKYGINNDAGVPSNEELQDLLALAALHNIDTIDSASAYGNAEKRLGQNHPERFRFISKFPNVAYPDEILPFFEKTLTDLTADRLYGYMAHHAETLIRDISIWNRLKELRAEGRVNRIGYSLYSPEQLSVLLDMQCIPDIVQLPYSLLDRKFENSIDTLKALNVEVHIRSAFLQGLYFKNTAALPEKLRPLGAPLRKLHAIAEEAAVGIGKLALSYVYHHAGVNKVVIGVDSGRQLKENINSILPYDHIEKAINEVNDIQIDHPELLNPVNW